MLSILFRSSFIKGSLGTVVVIVAISTAMDASLLTTAFFVALGAAPWMLMLVLPRSAPSPTVTEIIYGLRTNGGRR